MNVTGLTDDKSTLVRVMVWCRQATCHYLSQCWLSHYNYVIMGAMASQITNLTIVYSTVYSAADQRKYQSSASLAFVRGIHRWPVNSPHKWPVTREMFPFDDVILVLCSHVVTLDHIEYWGLNNMVTIVRTTFSNAFLERKFSFMMYVLLNFVPNIQMTISQHWSIGLGNGLMPCRGVNRMTWAMGFKSQKREICRGNLRHIRHF